MSDDPTDHTTAGTIASQLRAVADHAGPALVPVDVSDALRATSRAARAAFGAAATSIALVDPTGAWLDYVAADGPRAEAVEGLRLVIGRGIAGYVAQSGQAMSVDDVQRDPRFARDVAEQIGYVPQRLLCAPVSGRNGEIVGVLSVLDRDSATRDPMTLAGLFAAEAVSAVMVARTASRLGVLIAESLADMLDTSSADLASALRAHGGPDADSDAMARVVALLADLGTLGPPEQNLAFSIIEEVLAYARARRHR